MSRLAPPRLAEWVLRLILRTPDREYILGDLAQQYHARRVAGARARLWYWSQLFRALPAMARRFIAQHLRPDGPAPVQGERWRGSTESLVASFAHDIRFAIRGLRKSPGFTAAVLLTLALGIGANTAIFSVVNGVLLKPLPYPEPDRLVVLGRVGPTGNYIPTTAEAVYAFFKRESRTLERFGFSNIPTAVAINDQAPEQLTASWVTASLFETLGVPPHIGRWLSEDDGRSETVVLSHGLWFGHYASDPEIVGKTIVVNGRARTVVGVMPRDFSFPMLGIRTFPDEAQLWFGAEAREHASMAGGPGVAMGIARLRPGVSRSDAEAELNRLIATIGELFPGDRSAQRWAGLRMIVWPLNKGAVYRVEQKLWVVLGGVGFVLLIACANVANLFLVRADGRRREVAVRTALGAGRSRLARHFLAESAVLAGGGGLMGLGLAWMATRALVLLGPASLPRLGEVGIDPAVLAFCVAISLLAVLLFGAIAALRPLPALVSALKDGTHGSTEGRSRFRARHVMVVSQVALTLMLLVGAGLMSRSFWHLLQVDPGFDATNMLTFELRVPGGDRYSGSAVVPLHDELLWRIEAIPEVESAGATSMLPIGQTRMTSQNFAREEMWADGGVGDGNVRGANVTASPGYFRTMRMPLLKGRTFEGSDQAADSARGVRGRPVVVISKSMAERMFPGEDPIGRRVGEIRDPEPRWFTVVGVVGDMTFRGRTRGEVPMIYGHLNGGALGPFQGPRTMQFLVRTVTPPLATVDEIRAAVRSVDPTLAVANVQTMEDVVADDGAEMAFTMVLLAIAAVVALLLASVGIYGVLAYIVGRRTGEIGIRMALGARAAEVSRMVVRQGGTVVLVGLAIGLIGSLALTQLMEAILFDVTPTDPATYAVVTVFLLSIGLLATYLPARRAADVDPVEALRAE